MVIFRVYVNFTRSYMNMPIHLSDLWLLLWEVWLLWQPDLVMKRYTGCTSVLHLLEVLLILGRPAWCHRMIFSSGFTLW